MHWVPLPTRARLQDIGSAIVSHRLIGSHLAPLRRHPTQVPLWVDAVWSATTATGLTGTFRGSEHLGAYCGHGPKGVGAICDPSAFNGVVEVSPGVLGPRDGQV